MNFHFENGCPEIKDKFRIFKSKIEETLLENDIIYFIQHSDDLFHLAEKNIIKNSKLNERVTNFMLCFNNLRNPLKYQYFKDFVKKKNKWVYLLLSFDIHNEKEMLKLNSVWTVFLNFLHLIRQWKYSLKLNNSFFDYLYHQELISKSNKEELSNELSTKGNEAALFKLFLEISKKNPDWYGHFLYFFARNDLDFIYILCDDLDPLETLNDCRKKKICMDYSRIIIGNYVKQHNIENGIGNSDNMFLEKDSDEEILDYADLIDETEHNISLNFLNNSNDVSVDEEQPVELKLRPFQFELIKPAIDGLNAIIYAPTGSGKTNVAVYISNDHLKKNSNGKVAFLVHRIPLVTQQYQVFQKYRHSEFNVTSIHGKSGNISGPFSVQIEKNDIIVMTSDKFRNSLTFDDENKISSICEFSLIFFDECHNCMKSHPYTKIMEQYFKEKRENPMQKLPQIVGLTASPRSNGKNDFDGMKKSLFLLCANMDCYYISMVTENIEEMETYLSQPEQTVKLTSRRKVDEFEKMLIREMEYCERKLVKMTNERYFPATEVRSIPSDKYRQEYVGFVGNLEKLNTVTMDECDGKQKTFSIYRYLNAYYRGLIVNQMFNHYYAKKSIKKYLNHNGVDFSCSYDEEFYNNYEDYILTNNYGQSDNPAIDEIVSQIDRQMKSINDSRIIVFVRLIDFTIYLVDILKKRGISAEAIVGSNAKNDSKSCTFSEIDNILHRFKCGKTRVLVSTTVVEEGLDVVNCNMVISYGHVTNETALVQRRGRVRADDSKYILILPPMIGWMAKKEVINQRRKEMMNILIDQLQSMNLEEMKEKVQTIQDGLFHSRRKKQTEVLSNNFWKFTCKNCQTYICATFDLRIIENAHRVCIIPELLKKFEVIKVRRISFGSPGIYEYGGKVLCNKCNNYQLGNYVYYKKVPYFQLNIKKCNGTSISGKVCSFKKWADFAKHFEIHNLEQVDRENYCQGLEALE